MINTDQREGLEQRVSFVGSIVTKKLKAIVRSLHRCDNEKNVATARRITHNARSERTKTVQIEAKYSSSNSNRGL